jgi:FkbM family methyltransferase
MRKTLAYLKDFGFRRYLEKKVRKFAPAIHRRLYLGETQGVVPTAYGVLMTENWGDTTFRFCYFGTYGKRLSGYLESLLDDFVFLDVGANQGLYSLIAGKNPKCLQAIAFEPVGGTYELLEKNIRANDLTGRITPVNAGVSNQTGQGQIVIKEGHSGAASLRSGDSAPAGQTTTIRLVDAKAIDELIPPTGDIVAKVDVEGLEHIVIQELAQSRHFPRFKALFYEIDERWSDPAGIEALLRQHGFRSFRKMGAGKHYDILASR